MVFNGGAFIVVLIFMLLLDWFIVVNWNLN
mgnify:CR=1 FL=1